MYSADGSYLTQALSTRLKSHFLNKVCQVARRIHSNHWSPFGERSPCIRRTWLRSKCLIVKKRAAPSESSELRMIEQALQQSTTARDLRRVLCIWLRFKLSLSSFHIALALGMSTAAVRQFQSRYFKTGSAIFQMADRGGRRRAYLDLTRESMILENFRRRTRCGYPLNVTEVKRAYELSVGCLVSKSTIYRLISRNKLSHFLPRKCEARRHAGSDI